MDRTVLAALAEVESRFTRVRAGLDVGFADAAASRAFRSARGGVWMTVESDASARARVAAELDPKTVLQLGAGGEMPFDDHQFEVAVLSAHLLSGPSAQTAALVRETHRVLQGGGCLIFSVAQNVSVGTCCTQRGIYEMLRDGFDVVGLKGPAWWKFGVGGRLLTVCARRKNWRSRSAPVLGSALSVSPAMLSPRERKGV